MKPKLILRLLMLIVIACLSLLFLAGSKKPLKAACREMQEKKCAEMTEKASSNEFIFFESITKFLSVAIAR